MRRLPVLVAAAFLWTGIAAASESPNFDQKIQIVAPEIRVKNDIAQLSDGRISTLGGVWGPWQPLIRDSQAYKDATALRSDSAYKNIPKPALDPLEKVWAGVERDRTALLSSASSLETKDDRLASDRKVLEGRIAAMQDRLNKLNAEIDQFNQQCTGTLPPDQYQRCQTWRTDLQSRIDKYKQDKAVLNRDIDAWNARNHEVHDQGEKLKTDISSWENRIAAFISEAKDAEGGRTTVVFQAQGDDMPGGGKSVKADVALPYLCVEAGEQKLGELRETLTTSELKQRDQAFMKAQKWLQDVAVAGGLQGPQQNKPFYNDNPSPKNARVDIVIERGRAFVFCPAIR